MRSISQTDKKNAARNENKMSLHHSPSTASPSPPHPTDRFLLPVLTHDRLDFASQLRRSTGRPENENEIEIEIRVSAVGFFFGPPPSQLISNSHAPSYPWFDLARQWLMSTAIECD